MRWGPCLPQSDLKQPCTLQPTSTRPGTNWVMDKDLTTGPPHHPHLAPALESQRSTPGSWNSSPSWGRKPFPLESVDDAICWQMRPKDGMMGGWGGGLCGQKARSPGPHGIRPKVSCVPRLAMCARRHASASLSSTPPASVPAHLRLAILEPENRSSSSGKGQSLCPGEETHVGDSGIRCIW